MNNSYDAETRKLLAECGDHELVVVFYDENGVRLHAARQSIQSYRRLSPHIRATAAPVRTLVEFWDSPMTEDDEEPDARCEISEVAPMSFLMTAGGDT
jgi:hypothetical protein